MLKSILHHFLAFSFKNIFPMRPRDHENYQVCAVWKDCWTSTEVQLFVLLPTLCKMTTPVCQNLECSSVIKKKKKPLQGKDEYSRGDAAMGTSVRRNSGPLPWPVFCISAIYQCSRNYTTYLLVYSTSLVSCGTSAYSTSMTIYLVSSFQIFHMELCRIHQCCSPNQASPNIFSSQSLSPFKFSSGTTK